MIEIIGLTLDSLGSILIAYTAIKVHYRFRKEHKIDENVFSVMKREHVIGVLGIILIVLGYTLQMVKFF